MTAPGTLAFTYILPMVSMLIIYKNRNFIIRCGAASVAVLIYTIIRNYMNGMNTAADVVDSMEDLVRKSDLLGQKIDSSMEMTKNIDHQVTEVAQLIENIVDLSDESAKHANTSSKELKNVVETTKEMANLSSNVETFKYGNTGIFRKYYGGINAFGRDLRKNDGIHHNYSGINCRYFKYHADCQCECRDYCRGF